METPPLKFSGSGSGSGGSGSGSGGGTHSLRSNDSVLDVAALRLADTAGDIDVLPSRWTVFRMLIPCYMREMEKKIQADMLEISHITKAKIGIYPLHGVKVVMVSAIGDSGSPSSPAVCGLVEVLKYFVNGWKNYFSAEIPPFNFSTKLLLTHAQARFFLNLRIFEALDAFIYLSGVVSNFYPGDVFIQIWEENEHEYKAIELFASQMETFTFDRDTLSALENRYASPSICALSVIGQDEYARDARKFLELLPWWHHRREMSFYMARITMLEACDLFGDNGRNIDVIQQLCVADSRIEFCRHIGCPVIQIRSRSDKEVEDAEKVMRRVGSLDFKFEISGSTIPGPMIIE